MIRHKFELDSPLEVAQSRAALIQWLQSIGYRLTSPPFLSSFEAGRGSLMGNFGTVNPRAWVAKVRASFEKKEQGCRVMLELEVWTFGQVGTKVDMEFWTEEFKMTAGSTRGIMPNAADYEKAAKKAMVGDTWRAILFSVLVLAPIIAGLVLEQFVFGIVVCVSLAVAGYWTFRAPRRLGEIVVAETTVPPPIVPLAMSSESDAIPPVIPSDES